MKLIFIDTEYFSISKNKSSFIEINKNKKILFPEIFQFSYIEINSINTFNKRKKFNFYLKTKKKIPYRLVKLTNYNPIKNKSILFKDFIKKINSFFNYNTIIIVNGDDLKLLKMNMKFNKINPLKKKINYINLRVLFKKLYKVDLDTAQLKRRFLPNSSIKLHNALNDCLILLKVFKFIKNEIKSEKFLRLILKNIKKINI